MSDRPMRLKYLTKMKIILCIFLLCITAVSVFGEPQELNGTAGESVKFPAAVKNGGILTYSGVQIGGVINGSFQGARNEKFSGRLDWDSSTGLVSLSQLKMEDSGVFTVQNSDEPRSVSFSLTVKAVSVFGIEGKSIEFPTAVKTTGGLMYSGEVALIGDVTKGTFKTPIEKYEGRVHWDSNTGYFSLSGLRLNDSGVYTAKNTDKKTSVSFSLTVWIPVSKPNVSITHNEYPCTIECTAERGTGVTLSWHREGLREETYVTSPVESASGLHLPKTVERSGTYTCEAKNSVSNKTSDPLTVGAHCTGPSIWESVLFVLIAFFFVILEVLYFKRYPLACSSRGIVVLVFFLVVALIEVLIYFLYFFGSSTWIDVLVPFLIVAHITVLICSCGTSRKLEDTENELEDTKSKLKGLRGRAKRNEKPETEKGDPPKRTTCPIL